MAIIRQKIHFDSKKVTSGDPEDYPNHDSHKTVNKQTEPFRPQ